MALGAAPAQRGTVPGSTTPTRRERWARQPLTLGLKVGLAILGGYLVVAVSALVVFRSSLDRMSVHNNWLAPPPILEIPPSWAHPFGVLPGLGVDIFQGVWQATPWDLGIVAGILAIDASLGWLLGALAGMNEGSALDTLVMFVGDTLGSIPSVFLVVAFFAGLATVYPNSNLGLGAWIVLFGAIIWPATARTTRERARWVSRQPFLEAARASGASKQYVYLHHVLPNSLSPVLAQIPIDTAPIFFVLSVFPWFWDCASPAHQTGGLPTPYLQASLPPYSPLPAVSFPEWGNMLAVGTCEGLPFATSNVYWWMFLPPLVAIVMLGVGLALVCDGIDKRLSAAYG
jgi:peptide/nickel transport system permease protein